MSGYSKDKAGFGRWLRRVRLEKGMSQSELCVAIGISSTSGRISRYENGLRPPNDLVLRDILKALGKLSEWEKWCDKLGIPPHAREYHG